MSAKKINGNDDKGYKNNKRDDRENNKKGAPLIEKEREKVKETAKRQPGYKIGKFFKGKDMKQFFDEEAEERVKKKIEERLRKQARRLLRGPCYIKKLLDETFFTFGDILYAFVVGSYADEGNYYHISREWEIEKVTENDISKIKIPSDIDILIVYDNERDEEEETKYLRKLVDSSPKIEIEDDKDFNYEFYGISVEKLHKIIKADYDTFKDMTEKEIKEMLERIPRKHDLQISVNSIKIYGKEAIYQNSLDILFKDNEKIKAVQKEIDENIRYIRELTHHPREIEEYMGFWKDYFNYAKEKFPEEVERILEELPECKDIYLE